MDLKAIAFRGRWKSAAAVRRYAKTGRLQRQVNQMTPDQLRRVKRLDVGGDKGARTRLAAVALKLRALRRTQM